MLYLLGSIIFTSWLTLSFKYVERFRVNNLQAIVFNYFTCIITGSIINLKFPTDRQIINHDWFPWALVMGTIFILLFNLVGYTTQKAGVSVASVANKLSMVIPFVFSIYLYNESVSILQVSGIVLALAAVIFTSIKKQNGRSSSSYLGWLLTILLFLGSGLLDTMIKYVEQRFLDGTNNNDYLVTAFTAAGVLGLISIIIQHFSGTRISWKAVVAGICIGVPNYLSIWCLMKVLKLYSTGSSVIIPVNNMGIVLFSSVMSFILFREKLSMLNWVGIVLSLIAISLIAFG